MVAKNSERILTMSESLTARVFKLSHSEKPPSPNVNVEVPAKFLREMGIDAE